GSRNKVCSRKMRVAAWVGVPLKSSVNALEQDPIGNLLYPTLISQTSHLGKMASTYAHAAELLQAGIPLRVIPRQPGFDDPRFTTDHRASQASERLYAILDVNDSAKRNRTNAAVSKCRGTSGHESLSSILTNHDRVHP